MSLLPYIVSTRREVVDKRNSHTLSLIQPLLTLYNSQKGLAFSILPIKKDLRAPEIVDAFWQQIKQNETAFLVYGITPVGEKTFLKFLYGQENTFKNELIENQRFFELHFVRSSPQSIATEIGTLFCKASETPLTQSHISVAVSDISCFKHTKMMSHSELIWFRSYLEELIGSFEFFYNHCWRDYVHFNLHWHEITKLRIKIVDKSLH